MHADVLLLDGTITHIRPVRREDASALRRLYARLSERSLYLRFFTLGAKSADEDVARLTRSDAEQHDALLVEHRGVPIAVAGYERIHEPGAAEVAFVVDDAWQGRGVGTLLLEHLAAAALTRGVSHFAAETLLENARMLRVFHDAGLPISTHIDDGGTVRVDLPLTPTEQYLGVVGERERVAAAASLARVLAPQSIVVAGTGPEGSGREVLGHLAAGGYAGRLYAVNGTADEGDDAVGYRRISDVPGPVDLVVVAVQAPEVLDVAKEAAAAGAAGLVVLAAGFADVGSEGATLKQELLAVCRSASMRLIGPKSAGIANTAPSVGMNATFIPTLPAPGGISLMSQSGAVGIAAMAHAARAGVGISCFVSAGNKADVSGNDLLCYWEADTTTRVCALYLESFGNPRKFARIAARVGHSKPIVAVKSGRSAASGTAYRGFAATADIAVDSLLAQAGVIRVESVAELFDVATLLDREPLPNGDRVAIVGNSHGPGVLAADACEAAGLSVVPLPQSTQQRLDALLPPGSTVANPLGLAANTDPDGFAAAVAVVLDEPDIDAVIAVHAAVPVASADSFADALARIRRHHTGKPMIVVFLGVDDVPKTLRDDDGIPIVACHSFPEPAARALGAAVRYAKWRRQPPGTAASLDRIFTRRAHDMVTDALAAQPSGGWLDTATAVDLARCYGITVDTPSKLDDAHDGVTSIETEIGVTVDPAFGPLVMFGLGGVASDLLGDRAYRVMPLTVEDAADLVRSLRSSPLLFGYRDAPRCDVASVEDMLLRVARLADDLPEVAELHLNPVIATPRGATAVNVRIRIAPAAETFPLLRRLR